MTQSPERRDSHVSLKLERTAVLLPVNLIQTYCQRNICAQGKPPVMAAAAFLNRALFHQCESWTLHGGMAQAGGIRFQGRGALTTSLICACLSLQCRAVARGCCLFGPSYVSPAPRESALSKEQLCLFDLHPTDMSEVTEHLCHWPLKLSGVEAHPRVHWGAHIPHGWSMEGRTASPGSRRVKSKCRGGRGHRCLSGDVSDVGTTGISSETDLSGDQSRGCAATPLSLHPRRPDHAKGRQLLRKLHALPQIQPELWLVLQAEAAA